MLNFVSLISIIIIQKNSWSTLKGLGILPGNVLSYFVSPFAYKPIIDVDLIYWRRLIMHLRLSTLSRAYYYLVNICLYLSSNNTLFGILKLIWYWVFSSSITRTTGMLSKMDVPRIIHIQTSLSAKKSPTYILLILDRFTPLHLLLGLEKSKESWVV